MLGLVQADHLLVLYTCWELTSITSFLLIGNRHTESRARAAALHALLVTGAGGLVLLGGVVLLGREAGTYRHQRDPRRPATEQRRADGRDVPDAGRRVHEVGAVPVPRVVAGRDGGADAGERLPALGDDGEGGRDPRGPVRADVRRGRSLATDRVHGRMLHAGLRRSARAPPARPQAAAGVRHREPARAAHGPVRRRHGRDDDRRLGAARRPRGVQGRVVHGGRDHRPPDRDPRHPSAPGAARRMARHRDRHRAHGRLDGRRTARRRVRRQGARLRLAR